MYTIQQITDKNIWENLVSQFPEANFLQSWNWGEFHTHLGKIVERWAIYEGKKVVGLFECVKEIAKRGNYLTVSGGPIIDWDNREIIRFMIQELKNIAKRHNVVFIRFRPQVRNSVELQTVLEKYGVVKAPMHLTADLTLQLDLSQTEEQILAQMRKNTRYDIRRADKLGITTTISNDSELIKPFYDIQCELAKKQDFVPFSYDFFHEQFKAFVADDQVLLISSYLEEKLLAQAFIIFYNKEAVYHYGVSTPENAKLPGSYACQWRAIQEAKKRGCTRYNFWGIAPEDRKEHRFAGVSLFKRGFGGEEVEYLHAQDIPVSAWYKVVHGFEEMRRRRRGL